MTNIGSEHRKLLRIGGWAALIVVALTIAEIVAFSLVPQPGTVSEWFALFERAPVGGLIAFCGLEIPMYAMFVLVFLALFQVVGRGSEAKGASRNAAPGRTAAAVALALVLIGSAVFFATNNPFTMLTLTNRYAAAADGAERSALLAAGEAVVAATNQRAVGGFNISLVLVSVAGVLVAAGMLGHESFGRSTAVVGILTHGLSLADNVRQILTSSVVVALLLIVPGAVLIAIWFSMVGLRLLRLARAAP